MNEKTCIYPECQGEIVHPDHELCVSNAWAVIAAIAEATTASKLE